MSSDYRLETLGIIADINLDKLTPEQAQNLGLRLADLGETIEFSKCTLASFKSAAASFLSAAICGTTLFIFDRPHTLHGVLGGLLLCVGLEALNFWKTTQTVAEVTDDLNAEIERLRELQ